MRCGYKLQAILDENYMRKKKPILIKLSFDKNGGPGGPPTPLGCKGFTLNWRF